ncbi:MAG TPA: Uma2 family endonuclease [Saprospiraceae bacterium]|nr:Uma2 family endonuclease [Saprospiraceae bacterium]HMP22475.1 Uma2 family endonuclease [Saprospiraceae bacterium]
MVQTQEKLYTIEEYLALEEKSEQKHEFDKGKIIEMPGAKFHHNVIAAKMIAALVISFKDKQKNCNVLGSDMKIYIPAANSFVYPDVLVLCDSPQFYNNREDVLMNPLLVVEVLSESTANYDREEKFAKYTTLPSLREYVLISQDKPFVEAFYLHDPENELWKISHAATLEALLYLHSIDTTIRLSDIYPQVSS